MYRQMLIPAFILVSHALAAVPEARSEDEAPTVKSRARDVFQQLLILSDPDASKHLGLSEEQGATITDLKREYYRWGFAKLPQSPGPGAAKEKVQAYISEYKALIAKREKEFQPRVWEALNDHQKKRLQQILWQFDVAEALQHDLTVAKQIQLTSEQRVALKRVDEQCLEELRSATQDDASQENYDKRVNETEARRNARAVDVLTEEQLTTWKGLTGEQLDIEALRPRVDLRKGMRNASREFSPRKKRRSD
jgi:hypothetical protein